MKWTTAIKRSPYEKRDERSLEKWKKQIDQLEIDISKKIMNKAVKRLYRLDRAKTSRNAMAIYETDTESSHSEQPASIATVTTIPKVKKVSKEVRSVSSEVSKEEVERLYQATSGRAKSKVEMFEHELSIDEDEQTDFLFNEDTGSDEPTPIVESDEKSESNIPNDTEDDLVVNVQDDHFSLPPDKKFKNAVFMKFHTKTNAEVKSGWNKGLKQRRNKELTAIAKEEAMINKITSEFCDWAEDKGLSSSVINRNTITDFFRFKFTDNAIVESMIVDIKPLTAVPNKLVKHKPSLSNRAEMFRQIMWDKMDWNKPDRQYGFNTRVSKRKKNLKVDPVKHWLDPEFVPRDLVSTKEFFEPLLNSQILNKFLIWLLEDPESYKPKYLEDIGYIDQIIQNTGGQEKIMENSYERRNRICFEAEKYTNQEKLFKSTILRMEEILKYLPSSVDGPL